ncbi:MULTISPECIES: nucleotide exchange factor GrpE [Micromonospora]|uniref:Protein GrpE n=1 Tax=Micromonospora sicca TaxID=2202420 RepID=A0A317DTS7_9ACTN|nr:MULTISPECIES: nucleotide exchange factor GrpE [unclassified Micromonospora]MBM0227440.1 nucleotide exchange factor GrpE [Micromonospora sp. ATA51]MDZ5445521.1 nucleotide exchange factor GrpE [Micromonospora sp. 4G57]MDZ5491547.1 nucleotide exchange factor GrpE [Micromonospora sp. 4G53]PWR16215.1 nucleotide exchange factor GrpE [Micromonospora sp. 4G51]
MTEKPRAADPGATGSAPGGSATAGHAAGEEPRVVIRDKRKIRKTGEATTIAADAAADVPAEGLVEEADVVVDEIEAEAEVSGPPVVDSPAEPTEEAAQAGVPLGAELESLRAELDERTRDLQRVSAEYANYRKRVDRDRALVQEQAIGTVLAALLPILDDLDRAREHGDLVGPFGTVAEQLTTALGKFGLTAFGEQGDPFDPTRHEAVAHQTSADVTEPTCVQVMRRGYQLGERLLRPALVAVADPE